MEIYPAEDSTQGQKDMEQFFNLYNQGFIRTAVCVPEVQVADPSFNATRTIELARKSAENDAIFALFPELGISAYSNEDLFLSGCSSGRHPRCGRNHL